MSTMMDPRETRCWMYTLLVAVALIGGFPTASRAWICRQQHGGRRQRGGTSTTSDSPPLSQHYYANSSSASNVGSILEKWTEPTSASLGMRHSIRALNQTRSGAFSSPSSSSSSPVQESLTRAQTNILAILDMYDEVECTSKSSLLAFNERAMYASILLKTLDSVLDSLLNESESITVDVMELVEQLTTCIFQRPSSIHQYHEDSLLVPSTDTLHDLWTVYQNGYRNIARPKTRKNIDEEKGMALTESSSTFLRYTQCCARHLQWWRQQYLQGSVSSPPPDSYLIEFTQQSIHQNTSMSSTMWDLCSSCWTETEQLYAAEMKHDGSSVGNSSKPMAILPPPPPPRQFFSNILQILSCSRDDSRWSQCHSQTCRKMIQISEAYNLPDYLPTHKELLCAMEHAASFGHAQNVAWLIRATAMVDPTPHNGNATTAAENSCFMSYFLTALQNSNDTASFLYMEQFVASNHDLKRDPAAWDKLLSKWVYSGVPSAPIQVQRILKTHLPNTEGGDWIELAHKVARNTSAAKECGVKLYH